MNLLKVESLQYRPQIEANLVQLLLVSTIHAFNLNVKEGYTCNLIGNLHVNEDGVGAATRTSLCPARWGRSGRSYLVSPPKPSKNGHSYFDLSGEVG